MKAGKVGILVIMISLAGMLGIGWFMSMDVVMTEKTVYNELTDITPLFGSEQAPQYTDYTPSTNYTGYYTDDSVIDGVRYFGGVDYDPSARANVYRLELAPTATDTDTQSLSTITELTGRSVVYYDGTSPSNAYFKWLGADTAPLTDLLALIDTTDWDVVTIRSSEDISDIDNTAGQDSVFDGIIFSANGDWATNDMNGRRLFLGSQGMVGQTVTTGTVDFPDAYTILRPCVAISIDLRTGTANLFYDTAMTERAGIATIQDIMITYAAWPSPSTGIKHIDLEDTVSYSLAAFPPVVYMDPSKGVEMI